MNPYMCPWAAFECQKQTRHQPFAHGDCYVCIWKSIKILKIVQMKQISTGRITINRNDLKYIGIVD